MPTHQLRWLLEHYNQTPILVSPLAAVHWTPVPQKPSLYSHWAYQLHHQMTWLSGSATPKLIPYRLTSGRPLCWPLKARGTRPYQLSLHSQLAGPLDRRESPITWHQCFIITVYNHAMWNNITISYIGKSQKHKEIQSVAHRQNKDIFKITQLVPLKIKSINMH